MDPAGGGPPGPPRLSFAPPTESYGQEMASIGRGGSSASVPLPDPYELINGGDEDNIHAPYINFFQACLDGTPEGTEKVRAYVQGNPHIVKRSMRTMRKLNRLSVTEMWTPLHYAAVAQNPETMFILLESLIDDPEDPEDIETVKDILDAQSTYEMTPSSYTGIPRSATTSGIYPAGCSALHVACLVGTPDKERQKHIIALLIDKGIDLNLQTYDGHTVRNLPIPSSKDIAEFIHEYLHAPPGTYGANFPGGTEYLKLASTVNTTLLQSPRKNRKNRKGTRKANRKTRKNHKGSRKNRKSRRQ